MPIRLQRVHDYRDQSILRENILTPKNHYARNQIHWGQGRIAYLFVKLGGNMRWFQILPLVLTILITAGGTPSTTPPAPTEISPIAPTLEDTATPLPEVEDVPIYQNSFEGITHLAASVSSPTTQGGLSRHISGNIDI